ncbi:hypothetical protein FNV43_RR18036 [Rhamnella rubrinervis]|uniref:RING-type domain-containing protein n=1 Tax=Rhamnella rubrinervis TaxID=2594499 RepID=A0A8K0E4D6_9ROSA|nr:hypothetical protein FNV43_RR18036 [Rhamnella rubrinervis]
MNASMMGLFVDDLYSGMIVTHILYKAALVIAVVRWVSSWALRVTNRSTFLFSSPSTANINGHHDDVDILLENDHDQHPLPASSSSSSSSSSCSTQMIIDNLMLTTFGEIMEKLPRSCRWETCAVCLNQLSMKDEVRELRNCCHVFHRECLDRWLDHDHQDHHHKTCPLCRAPLLTPLQCQNLSFGATRSQPSWAVERLLYLFGDDLLI